MEKLTKREKFMLGITVFGVAAAGYFGYKYSGVKIKDELSSLKFLVVESDCVQKALQNAENKLSRKRDKNQSINGRFD